MIKSFSLSFVLFDFFSFNEFRDFIDFLLDLIYFEMNFSFHHFRLFYKRLYTFFYTLVIGIIVI